MSWPILEVGPVRHVSKVENLSILVGAPPLHTVFSKKLRKLIMTLGMGLTPLEGLIGGTRCGTIDPTAVFHLLKDPGADGGADGMKVSKAELTLNKCVLVPFRSSTAPTFSE